MNIEQVNVKLTGQDILSIINEFIKIRGLNFKSISIENGIIVEGSYHKGITLEFFAKAEIIKCENNKIYVRLAKTKLLKLGILRVLRSFVLKQLSKVCEQFGVTNKKEIIIINIDKALKDVPYINLNINDIYIKKNELNVEANNIELSIAGTLIKKVEAEEIEENEESSDINLDEVIKVNDNYSRGRDILKNRMSGAGKRYSDYIFILPDIISLIYRLLKDKRVPIRTKIMISSVIAYIAFPKDILPDRIPLIGKIDDLAVVFFLLNRITNDVEIEVIIENWEGNNKLLLALTNALEYLINFTHAVNVQKLYDVVCELSEL